MAGYKSENIPYDKQTGSKVILFVLVSENFLDIQGPLKEFESKGALVHCLVISSIFDPRFYFCKVPKKWPKALEC